MTLDPSRMLVGLQSRCFDFGTPSSNHLRFKFVDGCQLGMLQQKGDDIGSAVSIPYRANNFIARIGEPGGSKCRVSTIYSDDSNRPYFTL